MAEIQSQTPSSKAMKPSDNKIDLDFDSVSEVDREEVNGGRRRESDWKDARKDRSADHGPTLEEGAD